jgi:hypothetical protein
MPLSLTLSRFCLQLISFQRFCSGSPANPMIPEDHYLEGIPVHRSPQQPKTEPYKFTSPFSLNIPRCRHLKVNGTQCGSSAPEGPPLLLLPPAMA